MTEAADIVVYTDARKTKTEEIRNILRDVAGIDPGEDVKRPELIELCRAHGIQVDAGVPTKLQVNTPISRGGKGEPIAYTINITGNKDLRQVPVGVNGFVSLIKCDTNVRVKPEVLEVLRNAKRTVIDEERDDMGRITRATPREVPAYPVSIVETHFE